MRSCESGQILATDFVRAMAGRRSRHECRSLGELALKGLPDPVETVEVVWEPLGGDGTGTSHPASGPPGRAPRRRCGGPGSRDGDDHRRPQAGGGGGGREILLVSGEAGLGKTTLVAEAARSAFDDGACVLFGHCEEDLATPYQLFAEALGHYVTHAPEEQLLAHVEAHGSELSRLVPALASRIPDLPPSKATDADTERFLLFAAVVGLLAMASRAPARRPRSRRPPVGRQGEPAAAPSPGRGRPGHAGARSRHLPRQRAVHAHALTETLAALHRQDGVSRIELAGLDDSGVVALMEAEPGTLDDAAVGLAHAIYRETDGNPFFVSEVLRHLFETGAICQDAAGGGRPRTPSIRRPARQRAGGDRGPGRATRQRRRAGAVGGLGDRAGLRPRSLARATETDRGRPARHPRSRRGSGPRA